MKDFYLDEFGSGLPLLYTFLKLTEPARIHLVPGKLADFLQDQGIPFDFDFSLSHKSIEIIIGSSGKPNLYSKLIVQGMKNSIKVSVYFDNWVNYKERILVEPDEILVSDAWALKLAKECFPLTKSFIVPNDYLLEIQRMFKPAKRQNILLIGTPDNTYSGFSFGKHGRECICHYAERIYQQFRLKVIVRMHPGYPEVDCLAFLKKNRCCANVILSSDTLIQDLNQTKIVIGPVSYVHFIAESIGIPAFLLTRPTEMWRGPSFRTLQI